VSDLRQCKNPLLWTIVCWLAAAPVDASTIEINGEIYRDPTQPSWAVDVPTLGAMAVEAPPAGPDLSRLRLSFVRAGGLSPVAVINNQSYTLGDVIEGAEIREIRPGEVVFYVNGEPRVLSTATRPVRTPVEGSQ
jgi:hypothetical protein